MPRLTRLRTYRRIDQCTRSDDDDAVTFSRRKADTYLSSTESLVLVDLHYRNYIKITFYQRCSPIGSEEVKPVGCRER